jgi:hypothetical protein
MDAGRPALDAVLLPAGFRFVPGESGKGSGGQYVQGSYRRGERRLDFSVRWALGLVQYLDGARRLEHTEFIRATTRGSSTGKYPGFNDSPVEAFSDLASDLRTFGAIFLDQGPVAFEELSAWIAANPKPQGMDALQRPAL